MRGFGRSPSPEDSVVAQAPHPATLPPATPHPATPHPATPHPAMRLDPRVAGALVDPDTETVLLPLPGAARSTPAGGASTPLPPRPSSSPLDRRVAAELGVYVGAGLVVLAIVGAGVRGWASWESPMRAAAVALTATALAAAGLFVRLPWRRSMGDQRRRAVSVMLTSAVAIGAVGAGLAVGVHQGSGVGAGLAHVVLALLAMTFVNVVARSPLAETGLLVAGCWAVWVLVPAGRGTWVGLCLLGSAWALLGPRWALGRRTASAAGAVVALLASVGLSRGSWGWLAWVALSAASVAGLSVFLRGGSNRWLALGVGAATALAGAVAATVLSPALALVVAGTTTMAISGIALRGTRHDG